MWDTVHGNGGTHLAATRRIGNRLIKFQELLPFLTACKIGRVYGNCVRSSLIYGSETRSLLADVWLKFEGTEKKMIRCKFP